VGSKLVFHSSLPGGLHGGATPADPCPTRPLIKQRRKEDGMKNEVVVDFMTQSDANGNVITPAAAIHGQPNSNSLSTSTSDGKRLTKDVKPKKKTLKSLRRWFCCFVGPDSSDFADGVDESAHQSPVVQLTSSNNNLIPNLSTFNINRSMNVVRALPQRLPHIAPLSHENKNKKCLVLDLDETLVHSSLREEENANLVIPVNIDNAIHNVFVIKRPGVDEFLRRVGEYYEVIVYTASLSKYADPLLDQLDVGNVISKRLFRENCVFHEGHYVKDLSLLNRELSSTIIVDNSPTSYAFHPENAIDCGSFIDDPNDIEMWLIGDFLVGIRSCEDVRSMCKEWREWCKTNPSTAPKTQS
jgi:carboxy-terminal domain RNA polymerase II polypeptide A small phosphatase